MGQKTDGRAGNSTLTPTKEIKEPWRAEINAATGKTPYYLASLLLLVQIPVFAEPLPQFPTAAVWNQNISAAGLHPQSARMIATLDGLGGFGAVGQRRMQIDFSFHVVHAAPDSPLRSIIQHDDGYYSPDCEAPGSSMPVLLDAALEGQSGLSCNNENEDCHLLVVQGDTLYEPTQPMPSVNQNCNPNAWPFGS